MSVIILSPQQDDCRNWLINGTGSAIWRARAGTGKTFTVIQAVIAAIEKTHWLKIAVCCFNARIGAEVRGKVEDAGLDWNQCTVKTVHSFGYGAVRKAFPNVKLEPNKTDKIITEWGDEYAIAFKGVIIKLVRLARLRAIGVTSEIDNKALWFDIISHFSLLADVDEKQAGMKLSADKLVEAAQTVLKKSNNTTSIIDHTDMVYMPVLPKIGGADNPCRFFQFNIVIMDEAQDASAIFRCVARALLRKGGRFVGVGDDFQAINGFAGADIDSLDRLKADFGCVEFPLTVTRRCPKAIVRRAQTLVPDYEAHPDSPEGHCFEMAESELMKRKDLLVYGNVILCRVTKPLIVLAFKLLRNNIACNIEGRNIGGRLVQLATKWQRTKTIDELEQKLEDFLDRLRTKLIAQGREEELAVIEDEVEALFAVIDQCRANKKDEVSYVVKYIEDLFVDTIDEETGRILKKVFTLSTIHKSKGREWHTVMWYDPQGTCPHRWARQQWQKEEEDHLMYVAMTRSMDTLIDIIPDPKDKQPGKQDKPASNPEPEQEREAV